MILEGRPSSDLYEVLSFCLSVGLPVCLEDLDIADPTREEINKVAIAATAEAETIHASWFPVTAGMVEDAIWTADALGKEYKMKQTG